jgi:hypothetical protein
MGNIWEDSPLTSMPIFPLYSFMESVILFLNPLGLLIIPISAMILGSSGMVWPFVLIITMGKLEEVKFTV